MKTALIVLLALVLATPCAGQDRWQLTLSSGRYLWDLQLVRLDGEALVVRQADTTITVPVRDLTELRRVAKSLKRVGRNDGGRAVFGGLTGADDEVYQLTLDTPAERLAVIRDVLRKQAPAGP